MIFVLNFFFVKANILNRNNNEISMEIIDLLLRKPITNASYASWLIIIDVKNSVDVFFPPSSDVATI